ncbi:MAG: hypothetical protein PHD33_01620 [Atribacterota bacterium]|nr:hypothetical protein [Atribacterota bacterium]
MFWLRYKKHIEWLIISFLFLGMSYFFNPYIIFNSWSDGLFLNAEIFLKIILTGLICVIFSNFFLSAIVFRSVKSIADEKIEKLLHQTAERLNYNKKIPKVLKINTSQLNAISFNIINNHCLGLTTGLVDAYQNEQLGDKDMEYILLYLLSFHLYKNTYKRYLLSGITNLYSAIGYIFIYFGRGFMRLADFTKQIISKCVACVLGSIFLLIGNILKIPEKIGFLFARQLIKKFQKNADHLAMKYIDQDFMQETLQKIDEKNKYIAQDKKVAILPYPEYWFVQPLQLATVDKLFLFPNNHTKKNQEKN